MGVSGNVVSGAMTGFAIGGPYGLAFGAVVGGVIWIAGEVLGSYVEEKIKTN